MPLRSGIKSKMLRAIFGYFVTFFLIVVLNIIAVNMMSSSNDSYFWLDHTNDVFVALNNLDQAYNRADLAQREIFMYSRPNENLEEFRQETYRRLDVVMALTKDNPNQQKNLEAVKIMIDNRFKTMDTFIQISRQQGFDVAMRQCRDQNAIESSKQLESSITTAKMTEWALYNQRITDVRTYRERQRVFALTVFGFLYAVIIISGYLTIRTLHLKVKAAETYKKALNAKKKKDSEGILMDAVLADEILHILEETNSDYHITLN